MPGKLVVLRRVLVLSAAIAVAPPTALLADGGLQQGKAAQPSSLPQLFGTLKSGTWRERDAALKWLSQVPGDQGGRAWDALIFALEAENTSLRLGTNRGNEDYSEYYSRLMEAVLFWMTPERLRGKAAGIVINSIYDGDSRFAKALGTMGRQLYAEVVLCASRTQEFQRAGCLSVIGWMLKASNETEEGAARLKDAERYALLRTLRVEVLSGTEELAQIAAVRALVVADDTESIAVFETVERGERGRSDGRRYLLESLEQALRQMRGRVR